MNPDVKVPASLLNDEGMAWLAQGRERARAFDERADGRFFKRDRQIRDDYAKLSPLKFLAKYP